VSGRAGRLSHAAHLAIAYRTKPSASMKAKATGHFDGERVSSICFGWQGKKEWALEGRDGEREPIKMIFRATERYFAPHARRSNSSPHSR
jgi:hypothetical protein